ncbi:Ribosomal large subunit pseudouridine synthase D [Bacillus sp. THAF10]|uniref:RluA family pseudouridine synthase n=1 Tax=Bacillus sp. THAF10 TaxID=2587848 RepID=UPI001267D51D|nr:RluA family pseudouridine synthase [Bacillus sp. THAF10]QFT88400.1 Ribosomal large subunit pseudouridine synthase D [Bacillus sp. THAF10]
MKGFCLTFTIQKENKGMLLRDFLKDKQISKAALVDIKFHGGALLVNGSAVTVRYPLQERDVVEVYFPIESPSEDLLAEDIPLDIVYEDEYVLVINKHAGISSIPSREHRSRTLANGILHYYGLQGFQATIHIVTRLDRDTSGLMLIAKHRHAHHLFSLQQKKFAVRRRYEAVVHGIVKEAVGTIDAPIGRKDTSIIEREVREDGQVAVTHYEVLKQGQAWSHLSLRLETGRTHQIRVHMAHIGHPLVGDTLYGGQKVGDLTRQALHSCELTFFHPYLEKELTFCSELPRDMKRMLDGGQGK